MSVDFPNYGFSQLDMPPQMGIAFARTQGGLIVTSRHSDPFSQGTITSGDLVAAEFADLQAFLIDCVDRHLRIDFIHPRHRVPRTYSLDTLPFAGTATIDALPDLRTLTLSGLPVGLELKRGDRVALEQSNLVSCRWLQSDVTVTSNIAQDIPITPRLPIGVFAAGATARFKDPVLRMMVAPGSFDMPETYQAGPISFDFVEVLK